ncbi:MAG: DeoR/GlpR family DNA-binding transcription regulator [Anaerolineales bacterium]
MKNLSPRQRKILDVLTQKGDLAVAEIRAAVGISQATAYREIQALVQAGLAQKTPGGITQTEPSAQHCLHCHRPVHPRLIFYLEQADTSRHVACCAHCGLLALHRLGGDTRQAMTSDFLYGTLLNAAQAWYVLESSIAPCCHPSVLPFGSPRNAERFASAFGGQACDFSTAQAQLEQLMSLHPHH